MGRLERVIVVGALLVVGALVALLVWRGLDRRVAEEQAPPASEWAEPVGVPLQMAGDLALPVLGDPDSEEAGEGVVAVPLDPPAPDLAVAGAEDAPGPPEPAPVQPAPPRTYRVRSGDTLSGIAKRLLGSAQRWRDIQRLNPDVDPDRLAPGLVLVLPSPTPAASAPPQPVEAAARGGEADAGMRTYTVRPGDSLWKIAYRFYGGPDGVERILAANRDVLDGKDAVLRIGMTLRIPR